MSITIPTNVRDEAGWDGERGGSRPGSVAPAVVYLAAARNTYGTLSYRRALGRVSGTWPRAVVMDADACGFSSRADWHLRWPFIRDGIDSVVVLAEDDGTISHDTWLELRDATDAGLPCWLVTAQGSLTPVTVVGFSLYPTGVRTDRRWARAEVSSGS